MINFTRGILQVIIAAVLFLPLIIIRSPLVRCEQNWRSVSKFGEPLNDIHKEPVNFAGQHGNPTIGCHHLCNRTSSVPPMPSVDKHVSPRALS